MLLFLTVSNVGLNFLFSLMLKWYKQTEVGDQASLVYSRCFYKFSPVGYSFSSFGSVIYVVFIRLMQVTDS